MKTLPRGNPRLAHIQVAFLGDPLDDPSRRQLAEFQSGRPLLNRPVTLEALAALLEQILSPPEEKLPLGRRRTIIYRRTIGEDTTPWVAQPF